MQSELNEFMEHCAPDERSIQTMDASTVFKARLKLAPLAYVEMNLKCLELFRTQGPMKRWNGFQLIDVDGSTLRLPNTGDILDSFSPHTNAQGDPVGPPLARLSLLYDPLNQLCLSCSLDPMEMGEISQMPEHSWKLESGQLLIADRNYDAFWFFVWLMKKGCDFCIRLKINQRHLVREFVKQGLKEQIVEMIPGRSAKKKCRQRDLPVLPIKLRLIRVDLPNGEVEVLVTSVLDSEKIPADQFGPLYQLRWPVEEKFKQLKFRVNLENWSGKSAMTIFQDVYAKLWSCNLTVWLSEEAERKIEKDNENRQYDHQINWANAFASMKRWVVKLLCGPFIEECLERLTILFLTDLSPIRPNRKYPRNHKKYQREFFMNYKPCT